jgi:coiled-coil domain-containing protein 40
LGLKKRDEMIASIQTEIAKNDEKLGLMQNEIGVLKKNMSKALGEGETLTAVLKKLENEIGFINSQMDARKIDKEALANTFQLLEKTMLQTEQDLNVAMQEESKIRMSINSVRKQESQALTKIQTLDQQLYEKLQIHSAFELGASSTTRDNNKLRAQNEEKLEKIVAAQNEISAITVATANISNKVDSLKTELDKVDQSIVEKNLAIQTYDQSFKSISDQIKKKASQMDLLNKKLGSLTSDQVHNGPLESTIASLTKSLSNLDADQLALQTRYLTLQTDLVSSNRKCQSLSSEIDTLKLYKSSLVRKNTIHTSALATEASEIVMHNRNIASLQHDLQRLSTLIYSQGKVRSTLDSETYILKSNLIDALKQSKLQFIQLENKLYSLKSEKQIILDSILDSDQKFLNWTFKLKVLKQISDTLDPNTGSSELNQMSQEINRMGMRYKSILDLQERMVKEMERGVYRRTEISKRGGKVKGDVLKKEIEAVKGKIKDGNFKIVKCDGGMFSVLM